MASATLMAEWDEDPTRITDPDIKTTKKPEFSIAMRWDAGKLTVSVTRELWDSQYAMMKDSPNILCHLMLEHAANALLRQEVGALKITEVQHGDQGHV